MMSLHTNVATLSALEALSESTADLAKSQNRLSTGYRINSASDDAAGLQIATRLQAQAQGMHQAAKNIGNAQFLLKSGERALDNMIDIVTRMKELATQAGDASTGPKDAQPLQSEYDSLGSELKSILVQTNYGGEALFGTLSGNGAAQTLVSKGGKFASEMNFQVGAGSTDTYRLNLSGALKNLFEAFSQASAAVFGVSGSELATNTSAGKILDQLSGAIDAISAFRSQLGAAENRMDYIGKNLTNMTDNTNSAVGQIKDVDYASESANQQAKSVLVQAGAAMLKQGQQMDQIVLSLLK